MKEDFIIRIKSRIIHIVRIINRLSYPAAGLIHSSRIVCADIATRLFQFLNKYQSRSLTHIVRTGLECKSPQSHCFAFQISIEYLYQFLEQNAFLILVHIFHRFQHLHGITILLGSLNQRLHIFRETRATITASRIQELTPDTTVGTYSVTYHIYISSHQFAQVGNIVHKADTGGQHGVCRIFSHLGRRNIHENNTEVNQHERFIELGHQFFSPFRLYAHYYTVRTHKVVDSITFFQKFRIRSHIEIYRLPSFLQFLSDDRFYFSCRTHRHRTLGHDQGIFLHISTNRLGNFKHITQIGTSVFIRRSAHCTEHNIHIVQTTL